MKKSKLLKSVLLVSASALMLISAGGSIQTPVSADKTFGAVTRVHKAHHYHHHRARHYGHRLNILEESKVGTGLATGGRHGAYLVEVF